MSRYYPGAYMTLPPDTVYFITITVIDWVDVFTREEYKSIIAESLDYCRRKKGLQIYAWVLMTNHIHLIAAHDTDCEHLWKVIGDFKKFTSRKIIGAILENEGESRKKWMLRHFLEENILCSDDASCSVSKNTNSDTPHYHLWQRGADKYCILNIKHLRQKMDYIHANPVRAGIVFKPWEYRYCSYPNYCGEQGMLEIDLLDLGISDSCRYRDL